MSDNKALTISAKAAAKIREFMAQQGNNDLIVRVALVQTHCMGGRGYAYQLGFEHQIHDGDDLFESEGIQFVIETSSGSRLRGTAIDYVETLERQGFAVMNPNAVAKCPCGHHDIFEPMPSKNLL